MRIGATTIPLAGWLVDPRQPEQGCAHRRAAIRHLVEDYGLSAVELALDLGIVYPQVFDHNFYASVADLQQELGFACSVHLPFFWLDLASLNEPVRQTSVDCLRRAVELTQALQVATYVLHPWGFTTLQINAQLDRPAERQAILRGMMVQTGRSLAQVCEILNPRDLCVENLEAPPFQLVSSLIEQYGVSICLDVGHLAWEGGGEIAFLRRHWDRIREVHLHDAVNMCDKGPERVKDHLALGDGEIDYVGFLKELKSMGYEGLVILENNTRTDLEKSLERLKFLFDE